MQTAVRLFTVCQEPPLVTNIDHPLAQYRTPCLLLWSFCLQGAVYYANIYWLPIYFISLRRLDPVTSAAIMLALLIPQSIMSALMGIVSTSIVLK